MALREGALPEADLNAKFSECSNNACFVGSSPEMKFPTDFSNMMGAQMVGRMALSEGPAATSATVASNTTFKPPAQG